MSTPEPTADAQDLKVDEQDTPFEAEGAKMAPPTDVSGEAPELQLELDRNDEVERQAMPEQFQSSIEL